MLAATEATSGNTLQLDTTASQRSDPRSRQSILMPCSKTLHARLTDATAPGSSMEDLTQNAGTEPYRMLMIDNY